MSPEQIQGLKLVFAMAFTFASTGAGLYWVLTVPTALLPSWRSSSEDQAVPQQA